MINNINNELECILEEEQNAFENLPENLQCSVNGEISENAIDSLSEAVDLMSQAVDLLYDI